MEQIPGFEMMYFLYQEILSGSLFFIVIQENSSCLFFNKEW